MNEIDIILAESPGLGRVRLCECNTIHLTIGPVTLHLEPRALAQAGVLIRSAMDQLAVVLEAREVALDPLQTVGSQLTH